MEPSPTGGVIDRNHASVHCGRIENVVPYAIFVRFGNGRLGRVFYHKVPGCESPEDLEAICHIGDKIFVKIGNANSRGDIDLECIEFPVRD